MEQKKDNAFECSAVTKGLEIEITNYCGMDCIVCPRKKIKNFSFLSLQNFKKIICLLEEGNYTEVMVCGLGDAFLHKDINEFMEYLFSRLPNINLFFMTKGLALNKNHIDKIRDLKERGFNVSITFSIFSLNEKMYNYLTGGQFYKNFIEKLNLVKNSGINYSLEFMLSVLTLNELEKFKNFSKTLDKDYGISLVHNWGGHINDKLHGKLFDTNILEQYYIKRGQTDICEVMKYDYLYIDSNGKVFQCSLNELDDYPYLGKLGEHNLKGFLEIKNKLNYNKACSNCFYFNYKTFN